MQALYFIGLICVSGAASVLTDTEAVGGLILGIGLMAAGILNYLNGPKG